MQESASDKGTWKWFWVFAALHFVVWTAVPILTQSNSPLDNVEMLYWGHEWQWGYFKHPPLPAWSAETFATLFGATVWPTYLLSQICIVGCLWAAWAMGREVLKPWQALAGATVLELSLFHSVTTPEFNNNVMANVFWALFALFLYRGIVREHWGYWVGAGCALGLAFLSKYDVVLLAVSLLLFSFLNSQARSRWKTAGPYLMIGTSLLIIAPHLRWVIEHDFLTVFFVMRRYGAALEPTWGNHLLYPLRFLQCQLAFHGVLLAMVVMAVEFRFRIRKVDEESRFHRAYLSFVVCGPLSIAMLFSLVAGAKLGSHWGASMFTYLGVFLFSLWEVKRGDLVYRRVVYMSGVIGLMFAIGFGVRNEYGYVFISRPLRVDFPGHRLAEEIDRIWAEQSDAPLPLVGGDWWLAGNINVYHPDRPSVFTFLNEDFCPWTSDRDLLDKGGVIVWDARTYGPSHIDELRRRYPNVRILEPLELTRTKAPEREPLRVFVAVIPTAGNLVTDRPRNTVR